MLASALEPATPKRSGNPNLVKGGKSLNPNGRTPGSVNKLTTLQNKLIEVFAADFSKDFKEILKKIIDKAKSGDMQAAKMLMDRAIPVRKSVEHLGSAPGIGGITIVIKGMSQALEAERVNAEEAEYTDVITGDDNEED